MHLNKQLRKELLGHLRNIARLERNVRGEKKRRGRVFYRAWQRDWKVLDAIQNYRSAKSIGQVRRATIRKRTVRVEETRDLTYEALEDLIGSGEARTVTESTSTVSYSKLKELMSKGEAKKVKGISEQTLTYQALKGLVK